MHPKYKNAFLLLILYTCVQFYAAKAQNYLTPTGLNKELETLGANHPGKVKLHHLAVSPGGNKLIIAQIGPDINKQVQTMPAVFVLADPEGTNPLSAYAAIKLAGMILKDAKKQAINWYILPSLNPDALARYFIKPSWENSRNDLKHNEDQDDANDEDGPDDLNNDGFITQIRVKEPGGIWLTYDKDPRLLRKADPLKGEKGIYNLYPEGLDNDSDGQYNEDPRGGTNTGINFPHLFKSFTPTGGSWPGSTPEVYELMRFIYARPEIAATFTLGNTNFCLVPPEGGRKGSVDFNNIKIPDEMLEFLGAEKGKSYTMDEIIEMAQPIAPPGIELTPSMVASFLGLGAVVNPLQDDLNWYKELSEQYTEFLKRSKFDLERLDPEKAKDGSFELWSYYHLGIPSFSMNLFTLPKGKEEKKEGSGISLEKFETLTNEEAIALGEEKIQAFLTENNAPPQFGAQRIIEMLKAGQTNPKQMAGMMKSIPKPPKTSEPDPVLKALVAFSDKELGGKGYIEWKPFKHPSLGDAEIGGPVPYVISTPPFAWADSLISIQLPWIFKLVEKLPRLKISEYKVKDLGSNIYAIDIWIENTAYLPFPTAMGNRNNQPAPAILVLDADPADFLSGYKRSPIKSVPGLKTVKQSFIIKVKGKSIKASLESKSAGNDFKEIKL